jgi:hypothetical protein
MSKPQTEPDATAQIVADLLRGLHGNDDDDEYDGMVEAPGLKPTRRRSLRDAERLAQGLGAVYTPRRASELLPGCDRRNRVWLRQQGLIHRADNGKEVVIWAEVVDLLKRAPAIGAIPKVTARRRRRTASNLPRFDLGV